MGSVQQEKLLKVDEKLRTDRARLIEYQRSILADRKASEVARRNEIRAERAELNERIRRLAVIAHAASISVRSSLCVDHIIPAHIAYSCWSLL